MKYFYFLFGCAGAIWTPLNAQSSPGVSFFSSTYIHNGGAMHVKDYPVKFYGTVNTGTAENYGFLAFSGESVTENTGANRFVDGFVKSYEPSFEFPLGNKGVLAPVSVNNNTAAGVAVNYKKEIPENKNQLSETLSNISAVEYWKIGTGEQGSLTLTWRNQSNINDLVGNDLSELKIAGWNQTSLLWEEIPVGTYQGDINSGSITSLNAVDFSKYSDFTFAMKSNLGVADYTKSIVNLAFKDNVFYVIASEPVQQITFFDISGKMLVDYQSVNATKYHNNYVYPKGVYIAKILMKNGHIIYKKALKKDH